MQEYGFSLNRILPYKDRIYDSVLRFCPYTEEYGSVKTRICAYFMQCFFNALFIEPKSRTNNKGCTHLTFNVIRVLKKNVLIFCLQKV